MADEKLFYYRGFPLIRSGNTIFYGCGGDEYATILTIKGTKTVQDTEIPDKVLVQLVPTRGGAGEKSRKGEFTGFYNALDTANTWLKDALFD